MAAPTSYTNTLPRQLRKTIVMAKLESTYNNTLTPTFDPNTHAMWVEEVQIDYVSNNQTFNALQPYMGAKIEVSGNDYMNISFKMPISQSPYVSRDKMFGPLLQAAGMKRTAVAAAAGVLAKVIYNPTSNVTNANDSACFAITYDRVRYLFTGARGSIDISCMSNGLPALKWSGSAMFEGAVDDLNDTALFPDDAIRNAPEFGLWNPPRVVNARNSSGIYINSTLDLNTLTFDGGELYAHKGLSVNLGNQVTFDDRLGGDRILITDRDVTGAVQLDLSANREQVMRSRVRNNTNLSLGFVHGLKDGLPIAGDTCVIYGPSVQLINPKIEDVNGTMYTGFDLRFRSLDKNNDATDNYGDNELSIIFA